MTTTLQHMVEEARARIREIQVDELHRALPSRPAIIDVREPGEYLAGHVPGAVNIPRGVIEFRLAAYLQERVTPGPLYLYGSTGARAVLAAGTLRELGYVNVCSLIGGFEAWKEAGLPVTSD